jgi:multidrug resistance protein, MATE family
MPIQALVSNLNAHRKSSEGQLWAAESREIIKLGLPLVFTQLAQMAIITTDIIMVGQLGSFELASVTMGVTMFYFGWLLGFGPAAAVSPIIAQALGRDPNDLETPRDTVINGLWAAVAFTVPIWLVFLFVEPALVWIGQDPKLAKHAAEYTHAIQWGLPFAIAFMTLRGFCTALSSPRAPLIATALMIGVNAVLNYMLIYGHFGAPQLGIVGSGFASSIANAFGFFVLLAWVFWRAPFRKYQVLKGNWRPNLARQKELAWLGVPIGMTAIFEGGMFNAGVVLMGFLGPVALAAHQIAINFASITFMTALGLSMAGTVRVGLAAGAGDPAGVRRAGYVTMVLACGMMAVFGVIMAVFPGAIASLYLKSDDPNYAEVVRMAVGFLLIAAVFQVLDALQVAAAFALRGLKDAQMPMLITGVSYWVVGFPVCYLLAFYTGLGGEGIWWGYVISLGLAAVLLTWRFWRLAHGYTAPVPVAAE